MDLHHMSMVVLFIHEATRIRTGDDRIIYRMSNIFNCMTGGHVSERFCTRVGRNSTLRIGKFSIWREMERLLDFLSGEPDHCFISWKRDLQRKYGK